MMKINAEIKSIKDKKSVMNFIKTYLYRKYIVMCVCVCVRVCVFYWMLKDYELTKKEDIEWDF
jgi:hypothetical protein